LKEAAALLSRKGLETNEVAYRVGFSDSKYFSKEFKKQFSITPREFALSRLAEEGL